MMQQKDVIAPIPLNKMWDWIMRLDLLERRISYGSIDDLEKMEIIHSLLVELHELHDECYDKVKEWEGYNV